MWWKSVENLRILFTGVFNSGLMTCLFCIHEWIMTKSISWSGYSLYVKLVNLWWISHQHKYYQPIQCHSDCTEVVKRLCCSSMYRAFIIKSQRRVGSKWAKTVNICIIKANVKKSPSMSHRYHSVMHLRRNDSRNRFSHRKKINKLFHLECNTSHAATCVISTCARASPLRSSHSP